MIVIGQTTKFRHFLIQNSSEPLSQTHNHFNDIFQLLFAFYRLYCPKQVSGH